MTWSPKEMSIPTVMWGPGNADTSDISISAARPLAVQAGLSSTVLKIRNRQVACQQQWREKFTSSIFLSSAMGWQMKHEQTPERGSLGKGTGWHPKVGSFSFSVGAQTNQYPGLVLTVLFEHSFCLDNSLLQQEAFGARSYSFCFLEMDSKRKLYSIKRRRCLRLKCFYIPVAFPWHCRCFCAMTL